jgi:hypothetical protein
MYYLSKNEPLLKRLVNKQFQMIGEKVTIQDIENGVRVKEGKKEKVYDWWKIYFFDSEEQYQEWKDWAEAEIRHYLVLDEKGYLNEINYLDLVYGMTVRIKKQGELI